MRDFKVGELVVAMSDDKLLYQRGRVQWVGVVYLKINDVLFFKGDAVPINYEDQHEKMVYDQISDSPLEVLALSDTIEAIEKAMEDSRD